MSTRDRVKLTAHERQQLAGMEAALQASDPLLARVLKGQEPQVPATPGLGGAAGAAGSSADGGAARGLRMRELAHLSKKRAGPMWQALAANADPARAAKAAWAAARFVTRAASRPWAWLVLLLLGVALAGIGAGVENLYWLSVPGAAMAGVGCGLGIIAGRRSRGPSGSRSSSPSSPEAKPGATAVSG